MKPVECDTSLNLPPRNMGHHIDAKQVLAGPLQCLAAGCRYVSANSVFHYLRRSGGIMRSRQFDSFLMLAVIIEKNTSPIFMKFGTDIQHMC